MIKIMFKPFFKKYWGLFVSMVFVSALSIAMLCAFGSNISNLQKTCNTYLKEYQNVDAMVKTSFVKREDLNDIEDVEGVDHVDFRLTIDARLKREDGRVLTARVFSMNEKENNIFKPYVVSSIDRKENFVNVSVLKRFADNNNIKLGDIIEVGYFKIYIKLHVNEIVETPEGIQARANDYVWSDSTDFGYIYVSEFQLDKAIEELSIKIDEQIKNDEAYKAYYEEAVKLTGMDIPDLADRYLIGNDYCSKYTNQLMINAEDGYSEEQVKKNVEAYLLGKEVKVKQASTSHELFYVLYLENCVKQLRVASIFLPAFFYSVTMIIIGLFMNQIIKSMTKEIGVMMSVGVGFKDIRSIFLFFTLLMTLGSSLIGVGVGYGLSSMLAVTMRKVYSIPTIPGYLNVIISASACIFLLAFAEVATLISCRSILRITPKDATISNEAKRKPLPKALLNFIEKAPMNLKLSINSIAQNYRRFFVSVFSIFASMVIILLSLFFGVSKKELISQSVERRINFDAQIYYQEVISDEEFADLKKQAFVNNNRIENCGYTYLEVEKNGNKMFIECLAYDENTKYDLVQIPDSRGTKSQPLTSNGIIVPTTLAKELKIKKGDMVNINGKEVEIAGISKQYFHPIAYLSINELSRITDQYVSSVILDVKDNNALLNYLDGKTTGSLTVFTSNLSNDVTFIFNSIDVFIYIMIIFSLMMSFIILSIMGQNTLMEQKRPLTVLRAVGFTVKNISDIWTVQSASHLFLALLFAIPGASLVSVILFKLCSSTSQVYPFIFSIKSTIFCILFILLVIIATHLLSMFSIKKWNIADNTRCRE